MDGFVLGMTAGISLLLGLVLVSVLVTGSGVAKAVTGALMFGIFAFAYAYTPAAFRIEDRTLRIQRPASDVTVPLASILSVRPIDTFLGLSLKVPPGGNSGLFGLYGTFRRRDLGKYQLYGRAARNAVLIETRDGNVVVTPERRDQFVAELEAAMSS